jgi:hypothetical protein
MISEDSYMIGTDLMVYHDDDDDDDDRERITVALYINVILHKQLVSYIKIFASCRISGLFTVRNECSSYFALKRKKSGLSGKKSRRFVTLLNTICGFFDVRQEVYCLS